MLTREKINATRANIRRRLVLQAGHNNLKKFAFKISVNVALRDRSDDARPMVFAKLKQVMNKKTWHGVLVSELTRK